MITREMFEKIETFNQKYFEKWGQEPDYGIITRKMSPDKLIKVLERIVVTGESLGV